MRVRLTFILWFLAALPGTSIAQQIPAEDILIVNGKLVTMTEAGLLDGGAILVRDGEIVDIGPDILAPGAEVYDAEGAWVTPGLFDSATTVGLGEVESFAGRTDHRVRGTDLGAGFQVALAFDRFSTMIPSLRMDGVTHALIKPFAGSEVFAGQSAVVRLGDSNAVLANDSNAVFAYLGEDNRDLYGGSRAKGLLDIIDALNEAKTYRENRRDFERRRLRDLRQSELDLEALLPVLEGDKPLAVYVERASEIEMVVNRLAPYELNLVVVGGAEAWKVRRLLALEDIPVVLNVTDNLPSDFDQIGARLENAAMLDAAGVTVGYMTQDLFSDMRSLRQAAGVSVAYGMLWEKALAAITINAARIWGVDDSFGTLEAGKEADIVVWDGDPLEVMSAPIRVMIEGEWVEMKSRQTLLRDRYSSLDKEKPPSGYR